MKNSLLFYNNDENVGINAVHARHVGLNAVIRRGVYDLRDRNPKCTILPQW